MESVRRSGRVYCGRLYRLEESGANDGAVLKQPPFNTSANHCNGTIRID